MKQLLSNKKLWTILLIVMMLLVPILVKQSSYYMTVFVMMIVYAITAMALNLLIGYGGLISVGHAGFLAIGGYVVAILTVNYEMPFFIAFPMAGVITGVIGFIIGLPAVRLSGQFLAVVTLGFGLSVPQLILYLDDITGGYSGLSFQRPGLLENKMVYFYVVIIVTVLLTWMLNNIIKGRLGRAFVAVRESEVAAQSTGINVALYKTFMFAISATFTGLAGGIYAYWIGFVSPNDFTIVTSFLLLAMIVVGGLASLPGAVIGAVIFTILPELTSSFVGLTNLIIGLAVVIIILFRPTGIMSGIEILLSKLKQDDTVSKAHPSKVRKGE